MEAPEDLPELLNQFRKNLSDILTPHHTDAVLLKWLRARNYNRAKAEINFREVDSNRKIVGINTLVENYVKPEMIMKYERTALLGFAKDGTPVRYSSFVVDYKGYISSMSTYDMCVTFAYFMELDCDTLRQESKKTGRELNETTYIFDLEGFSLKECVHKCVIETGMDLMRLVQDYYPEAWKHVIFVNAPGYFYRVYNFLMPLFRPTLLEKIQVVPKDRTAEVLRKYIDDDVLPAFLGGQRVDSKGDPRCFELFPMFKDGFSKVTPDYFVSNRIPPLSSEQPGVQCCAVGARSLLNIPFRCTRAGAKYRYRFRTEGGSISSTMLFTDDLEGDFPASDEPIVPYEGVPSYRIVCATLRVQSHIAEVDGIFTMPWTGTYILQLDNSSSWFGSRTLFYCINEIPSES